jgi:hypothetical protein
MEQTAKPATSYPSSNRVEQDQLAATHQLGERSGYYPCRTGRVVGKLFLFAFLIVTGLAFLLLTIAVLSQPSSDTGDTGSGGTPAGLVIFGFLIGGFLLVVGIKELITACQDLGTSVYLYQGGFIRKKGRKNTPVRWDQVKELRQEVTEHYRKNRYTGRTKYVGTTYAYTVRTVDGKKFVFRNAIQNIENLGNHLSQAITRTLLPQAIMAYRAGQTVTFGRYTVSQQGVSNGYESLSWDVIESMGASGGHIYIRAAGKSRNWDKYKSVPNAPVLIALVNYILDSRKKNNVRTP